MTEKKKEEQLPFEQALSKLETIVKEMEGGELSLEQSMKKFEEGVKLASLCGRQLGETEKRVEVLLKEADESLSWKARDEQPDGPSVD